MSFIIFTDFKNNFFSIELKDIVFIKLLLSSSKYILLYPDFKNAIHVVFISLLSSHSKNFGVTIKLYCESLFPLVICLYFNKKSLASFLLIYPSASASLIDLACRK